MTHFARGQKVSNGSSALESLFDVEVDDHNVHDEDEKTLDAVHDDGDRAV